MSLVRQPGSAFAQTSGDFNLRAGFSHWRGRQPQALALSVAGQSLTYEQVDDTARRWSGVLMRACKARPERIGVLAFRSPTVYLGELSSLFAGAAFVPLNPALPAARLVSMIEQARPDALIVGSEAGARWREISPLLDGQLATLFPYSSANDVPQNTARVWTQEALAAEAPMGRLQATRPDDLAYLMFTSGSTGAPKGVPITHRNIRAFLDFNRRRYGFVPHDRFSQTFDHTFDLSIFDVFMAWESGASVHVPAPIELMAPSVFVRKNDLSVWFSVPSIAKLLLRRSALAPGSMPSLRWSLFCGEALPSSVAQAWQAAAPHSIVENLYGPTELTVACAAYRWNPDTSPAECEAGIVPIGSVYDGLPHLVVNDGLIPTDPGNGGELCVGGAQTSPGYWGAPELTARAFFDFSGEDGSPIRYYRTGDRVARRGPNLVFLGRLDQQVKINGYRVELLEVESVLKQAGCDEAVVLAQRDGHGSAELVAVVTGTIDPPTLLATAARWLPAYMLPRTVLIRSHMPLSANGKIDRNAVAQSLEDE